MRVRRTRRLRRWLLRGKLLVFTGGGVVAVDSTFPIVSTADLPRALAFYRDLLGGTVVYQFPNAGEPVYVGLDAGSSHLGIGSEPSMGEEPAQRRMALWVYVDDCDVAIERLRTGGVTILEEPSDSSWGERMARVTDPDGNHVIIGARKRPL